MRIIFALVCLAQFGFANHVNKINLIAEGTLPAIHKLEYARSGAGQIRYQITAQKEEFLFTLVSCSFQNINKTHTIQSTTKAHSVLKNLFTKENKYKHYSDYGDGASGSWDSWTLVGEGDSTLLEIGDEEFEEGLHLGVIDDYSLGIIAKEPGC